MKQLVLFYLALFASIQTNAQISKVETYQIGTQIDYYIGECGNSIPEAQGKLSFCDRDGNLGVVEKSLGLNYRGTLALVPNYYNDTEVYVTRNGVSMRKNDGSWENIPNVAFQNPELASFNNSATVTNGVVLPDGQLLLHVNGADFYVHTYNLLTKELTLSVSTATISQGFPAIRNITYDPQTEKTYVFMISGNARFLYEYTGTSFILLNDSDELSSVFSSATVETTAIKDGVLYVGGPNGLFTIDLENPSVITKYDASDTGLLPFNRVNDFEIAADGMIWLAQQASNNNAGGVTKFDITNETYEVYTQENPGPSGVDILPNGIALNPNGTVHLSISNYGAIADLNFTNGVPVWSFIENTEFDTLGVPITYIPNNVYVVDGKVYYTTSDFSSGTSSNYEVLIRDGNSWTGRNDNAPGNISFHMVRRFREAHPTKDGGSWWMNDSDDIIVRVDGNGNLTPDTRIRPTGLQGAVDDDHNYVGTLIPPQQGSKILKVLSPTAYEFASENNGGTHAVAQYNDQLWVFNNSFGTIEIYIDNTLIQTYDIDPAINLTSYFRTAIDRDGIFWALKFSGGIPTLLSFDRTTDTTTEAILASDFGTVRDILPSPDGGIWLLSSTDAVFYKDGVEYAFPNDVLESTTILDGIVDANGKLHLITGGGFVDLVTIENPTSPDPIIETNIIIKNNGLLPSEGNTIGSQLIIDINGDYWIKATKGLYKLIDNDTTPYYRTEGVTKGIISGRLYADIDENGTYDNSEAMVGVSVAVEVNGEVYNTVSDKEGVYRIFAQAANTAHKVTVTSVADDYYLAERTQEINITTLDQNYENNDFILELKAYDALIVKQGQRMGVWGFDRPSFENTFTIAISNMSGTKTFNELETGFIFENENGGSLPEIVDVKFTKLDPNGVGLLHQYVSINAQNNRWMIQGISLDAFTREEVDLPFTTSEETGIRRVNFTIPAIAPRDTWVIEIKTDLFDPAQAGTGVSFTTESMSSPSFDDLPGSDNVFVLYPEDQRDYDEIPLPSEDPNSPYIDPLDPDAPFFSLPEQVYAPSPYRTNIYSSYDPNDKMVDGGTALEVNETDIARKWLTYTIRFENQGNFSAKDVYILDELEDTIIPDSFTLLESSDPVEVELLPSGENLKTVLRFSFNDIFLPFDDENNDGWVKFRVRVKEDIAENTIVANTASIYFDQNPPIITNTIQNLFKTPEVVEDTEAPDVVCQNITVSLDDNGLASFTAQDLDGGSTDNVGITSLVADVTSLNCDNLGENEVVLTGMDAAGNMNSCTAIVTVVDEISPTAMCRSIEVALNEQGQATITVDLLDNNSTDNCGIVSATLDTTTFTCADLGENTVTMILVDASGNEASCEATVTIIDTQAPEVDPTTLPEDQTVLTDENNEYLLADFTTDITVIENCGFSIVQDPSVGTLLDLGVYTIEFTFEDDAGNTTLSSFELTVDSSLGLDTSGHVDWLVYPNPVRNMLYVDSDTIPTSLQLYDLGGKLVKESRQDSQLEMTALRQGIYLLKVISGESVQTFKVVKQ